jgi:anti-sigma-K factor RskA
MEHEQLEESVAAYALGALDDAGRAEVERRLLEHLAGCASCRELFNDLREVSADLALAVAPVAVRPEIEERILEGIRERKPRATQTSFGSRRRSPIGRVAVAAVAAALVSLGVWNVSLTSRVNDANDRTATIAAAVGVMGAPDARAATLTGSGSGTLVFVSRPGEAVVVGHDIPALAEGNVLQLWLMRAGIPTSAGAFRPTNGVVVLRLPLDAAGFDAVAVTEEKAPRAARPTAPPIYSATIRA